MKKTILAASAALLLASCAGNGTFSISGNIEGADNQPVLLENSINGYWVPIDSTRTDGDGDFKIKHQSPDVPQVYRLTVNDRSVYFPVDSLDDITIKATLANFATDYSLTGSDNAENMARIDHRAREIAAITDALTEGDKVQLTGFGTFEVRDKKEKEAINPRTKEKIIVPARKSPAFKAGKALKDAVQ